MTALWLKGHKLSHDKWEIRVLKFSRAGKGSTSGLGCTVLLSLPPPSCRGVRCPAEKLPLMVRRSVARHTTKNHRPSSSCLLQQSAG